MNILSERSVFKISGEDSFDFLQSVVTADISPLKEERAVATCLLSAQGRVLYDMLVSLNHPYYSEEKSVLIEYDFFCEDELIKKLNIYNLRKYDSVVKIIIVFLPSYEYLHVSKN